MFVPFPFLLLNKQMPHGSVMGKVHIITNNPAAARKYPGVAALHQTDVAGIFRLGRDAVHFGAVLIGHPLAGSVKPNESPYKSLVLSSAKDAPLALHADSLKLIEAAREALDKMPVKNRAYPSQVLDDFMVIDLDLLDSAIAGLPAQYHL